MLVCREQTEALMGLNSRSHKCSGTHTLPFSLHLPTPQHTHPSYAYNLLIHHHQLSLPSPSIFCFSVYHLLFSLPFWPLYISLLSSQTLLLFTQSVSLSLSLHQQNICFYDHVKYNMVSIKYIKRKQGCVCVLRKCVLK